MTDPAAAAKRRIEACVMQATLNAKAAGEDTATAAADLLCAFILMTRGAGANHDDALKTCWAPLNGAVADWWPDARKH